MGSPSRRAYLAALSAGLSGLAGCQSLRQRLPGTLRIEAETTALRDTDPGIVVRNVGPQAEIELVARSNARFETWSASAVYRADSDGVIRVSETAPIEGSYAGVDGAGLLWSMAPPDVPIEPWSNESFSVDLRAMRDGRTLDQVTLDRRRVDQDVTTLWVTAEEVVGVFAEPDIDSPRPGIMVLHGSRGMPLVHYAQMFASHGFPALALKYFGAEPNIPDHLQGVPLEYFDDAAAWLRARPSVVDGPMGVYGFSRGGEAALFLAAYADWVGAVVGDAPSGIAWQAVGRDGGRASGSAWSVDGESLPYVPYEGCSAEYTDDRLRRDAAYYECGLANTDPSRTDAATFPIERFDGPILCISGAEDDVWPSVRLTEAAIGRLRSAGRTDQLTHLVYEDAGHDIPIPHIPTTGISAAAGRSIGGTPAGIARAAADSWPQILATFETLTL